MNPLALASFALVIGFVLFPPLCVVAELRWAHRLSRRLAQPPFARWVSHALTSLSGVLVGAGLVRVTVRAYRMLHDSSLGPAQRMATMSSIVAEHFYNMLFGLFVTFIAALWIGFSAWRWRDPSR